MRLHQRVEKYLALRLRQLQAAQTAREALHHAGQQRRQDGHVRRFFRLDAPDQIGRHTQAQSDTVVALRIGQIGMRDRVDPPLGQKFTDKCRRAAAHARVHVGAGSGDGGVGGFGGGQLNGRLIGGGAVALLFFANRRFEGRNGGVEDGAIVGETHAEVVGNPAHRADHRAVCLAFDQRVGTGFGHAVEQAAHRMIAPRKETAIQQRRLDGDNLQARDD